LIEIEGNTARETTRYDMVTRIREVEQAPDGSVWVLEDRDGGRLLKSPPANDGFQQLMELIVFDLDGTLLNSKGAVSTGTRDTLIELSELGVAYTVATGRTLHAARELLAPHGFCLPQIYKNGVMIWDPAKDDYSHQNYLSLSEVEHVLEAILAQQLASFVFTLEAGNRHAIYHTPLQSDIEQKLAEDFDKRSGVEVLPASKMPFDAEITNISALGDASAVAGIEAMIQSEPHLVAYAGEAWEGKGWRWIDVHHSNASKGSAVEALRRQLGASRVVVFGDGLNDLSMFDSADEAYAPANASDQVKQAASAVIGHHDEDGIAQFLRDRFNLK
jgi:Cof subfamily protein (haloacid dehalogenase superfamily)